MSYKLVSKSSTKTSCTVVDRVVTTVCPVIGGDEQVATVHVERKDTALSTDTLIFFLLTGKFPCVGKNI